MIYAELAEALQAHLRDKPAKEPSTGKAVQPNAAIAASGGGLFKQFMLSMSK